MFKPSEPAASPVWTRPHLVTGMAVLDRFESVAGQIEKNAVHAALFTVLDRTVFSRYLVVDDNERPMEFTVLVRPDLVMDVIVHDLTAFGIRYIGPLAGSRSYR